MVEYAMDEVIKLFLALGGLEYVPKLLEIDLKNFLFLEVLHNPLAKGFAHWAIINKILKK